MPVYMDEEGGGEDIAGPGGVNFACGIGGEALGNTVLKEGGAVPTVGGDQQGDLHAPAGQDSVGVSAIAVGEWEQVVMTQNENVEERQYFFSGSPGSGPDTAIVVPAA